MSDFAQAIVDHLVAQDNWGTFSPTDSLSLRDVGIDGVFDLEALAEFCSAYLRTSEADAWIEGVKAAYSGLLSLDFPTAAYEAANPYRRT